jgi:hypothetical protein
MKMTSGKHWRRDSAPAAGTSRQFGEDDMDKNGLIAIVKKRLALEGEELDAVLQTPKFQRLFENAAKGARYRLVADVVASKGCHSGHVTGQRIVFDSAGNLLTRESPRRVCAFLMPNLTVLINAFFENLMNGRDPNEVMFNRTGCFDVGPLCGGWGHVQVEMRAEMRE